MQGKRGGSLWHYRSWNHHSGGPCQNVGTGLRNLAPSELCKPSKSHSHCNLASGAVEGHACCRSLGSPSATLPWIWGWNVQQIALNILKSHTVEIKIQTKSCLDFIFYSFTYYHYFTHLWTNMPYICYLSFINARKRYNIRLSQQFWDWNNWIF